jgi:small nuclear ribonucleoprotein E
MSYRGGASGAPKVKKVMTQAINLMFEYLKNKERVSIWLYENTGMKIEGVIVGFDEYMNVVLDDAEEVNVKNNDRKRIGKILLKGDCITLVQRVHLDE